MTYALCDRGHLGEVARSKASLRQCLALRQQWHGQVHPEVATVLLALARLINSAGYKEYVLSSLLFVCVCVGGGGGACVCVGGGGVCVCVCVRVCVCVKK